MSPLVSRPRAGAPAKSDPTHQPWGMLVFESLSAGAMAVAVGMAAVLIVVGVYVVLIWPLTFWDLAGFGGESFDAWAETILWSIFAGGTLAGFWCFSGAAFKNKPKGRVPTRSGRLRK